MSNSTIQPIPSVTAETNVRNQPVDQPEPMRSTLLARVEEGDRIVGIYEVRRIETGLRCDDLAYRKLWIGDHSGWLLCYLWPEATGAAAKITVGAKVYIEARVRHGLRRLVADISEVCVEV